MKNYYYFLGVSPQASMEEIKTAYRKLSLKYHPDKNNNDEFFSERFKQLQEAYEALISQENRTSYDQILKNGVSENAAPPILEYFKVNKAQIEKNEEISISWKTKNADMVKILPFGLVKSHGEMTVRITDFKKGKFHIVMQLLNTTTQQSIVKGITIKDIHYQNSLFTPIENSHPTHKWVRLIFGILLLIMALFFLIATILN